MKKRLISIIIFIAYTAILIKVMVFKDLPLIRVGHLMFNFGGVDASHPANFVPFKTILYYLFGDKGLIIAGINLVGNIALLVPIGLIVPFIFRNMTWKKSLALGVVSGLVIEILQTVLHVGIFDIDDVILNAFGVMIGYWAFVLLAQWVRSKNYKNIIIAAIIVIAAAGAAFYAIYPHGQQMVNDTAGASIQNGDLCGGTGGNGQIVSVGNNTVTMKRREGGNQIVTFTNQVTIKTSAGPGSVADLKIGDRITLVGGPNPDGSFTADTIVVCSMSDSQSER